jgi:excinuclease ABC subunit C
MPDDTNTPLIGVSVIERTLATLPMVPGVYRMLNAKGDALYVGKARNLRNRVRAYTQLNRLPERLRLMVMSTVTMEIVTTHTEAEALLLEANLIKKLQPRFNILLKDDKSYPWLILTEDHNFPQIAQHRGTRNRKASYWGPFASASAVSQTIKVLQRAFLLRSCTDSVFAHRSRPCLLYQIRRCSGPCVGHIDAASYAALVGQAKEFLSGKSGSLQHELALEMEKAAEILEFERAAIIRDRIKSLTSIQSESSSIINPSSLDNADIIAAHQIANQTCVQVFFVRNSHNNGSRALFPRHDKNEDAASILSAFIMQFYDDKPIPPLLLLSHMPTKAHLISEALSLKARHRVELMVPQRGEKHAIVLHAETNAREALERKLADTAGQAKLLEGVASLFGLDATPERIECYDNSHIMGSHAYGVMVVAGPDGFRKNAYRKYSIRGHIAPGDDFAMMREVLQRRFGKAMREEKSDWPDLVLIDGGAGQLSATKQVFDDLGITDVMLVAMAKGPDRNAGCEWFHSYDQAGNLRQPFQLPLRDPVLYYLQRVRDETHRFAITTHRASRSRALTSSELDDIPGIGAARKRALLNHFGSARGVKQAGLHDLENAPGINRATARLVFAFFNPTVQLP